MNPRDHAQPVVGIEHPVPGGAVNLDLAIQQLPQLFMTTSQRSKPARHLGLQSGVKPVDRSALAEWMARGASVTPTATITPGPNTMRLRHRFERPSPAESNRTD